jgi:heterotetrameric sarcosine oxidase delta subunit
LILRNIGGGALERVMLGEERYSRRAVAWKLSRTPGDLVKGAGMLLIPCPWCGPRDETEFAYGGEAHLARPADPDSASDAEWTAYLFLRSNAKGRHRERWNHAAGCRRWFNVERDTTTNRVIEAYKPGEPQPGGAP